jgi:hypothetical protein
MAVIPKIVAAGHRKYGLFTLPDLEVGSTGAGLSLYWSPMRAGFLAPSRARRTLILLHLSFFLSRDSVSLSLSFFLCAQFPWEWPAAISTIDILLSEQPTDKT